MKPLEHSAESLLRPDHHDARIERNINLVRIRHARKVDAVNLRGRASVLSDSYVKRVRILREAAGEQWAAGAGKRDASGGAIGQMIEGYRCGDSSTRVSGEKGVGVVRCHGDLRGRPDESREGGAPNCTIASRRRTSIGIADRIGKVYPAGGSYANQMSAIRGRCENVCGS